MSNDLSLPLSNNTYGTNIEWNSSKPDEISNSGKYGRVYHDTNVTLTATIKYNQESITATYEVIAKRNYKELNKPIASGYARKVTQLTETDYNTLDIITCAFATLNADGSITGSTFLNNCKNTTIPNAHAKGDYVVLSLSPSSKWTTACDPANNLYDTIATNVVNVINTYGFDGIDIDWEYPKSGQYTWFTNLVSAINAKVKANNPNHLVTAAIGGGKWQPAYYDLTNSAKYLDYINVMLYSMCSGDGYYQNALYKSTSYFDSTNKCGKTLTSCSVDETVKLYRDTYGVSFDKLIIGIPFYGIRQSRTFDEDTQKWSSWGSGASVTYATVKSYIDSNDYDLVFDTVSKVPYLLSKDKTRFVSYENSQSINAKAEYVINNNLAGIFFWDNQNDLSGELIGYLKTALSK